MSAIGVTFFNKYSFTLVTHSAVAAPRWPFSVASLDSEISSVDSEFMDRLYFEQLLNKCFISVNFNVFNRKLQLNYKMLSIFLLTSHY